MVIYARDSGANNGLVVFCRGNAVLESVRALRVAQLHEAPSIAALVNAATANEDGKGWTHESGLFEGTRTDPDEVRGLLAVAGARFLLRTHANAIVGCAYLKPMPDAAYFGMLSVRPDMQGLGIASDLISECERVAREEWQRRTMLITVITTHRPELVAFYQRRGYRRTGRFKLTFDRKQLLREPLRIAGLGPEWMEKVLTNPEMEATQS